MGKIKVIQYGIGAMGSEMVKIMLKKKDIELVGAICHSPEKSGKDLGYLIGLNKKIGIKAYHDPEFVCKNCKADIVLHAAVSYVPQVWDHIQPMIRRGMRVITIAEEMGYPFVKYPELSKKMDGFAKKHNTSILGSGINPGFAMDIMPLMLSGICQEVDSIKVTRLIDFSPFGPQIQKNIGIGMSINEFNKKIKAKELPLHIGLPESTYMLTAGLKWKLDKIYETRGPIVADRTIKVPKYGKIDAGKVVGFNHKCFGLIKGKKKIILEELGRVDPRLDYRNIIQIKGIPDLTETINVPLGYITTTSHAVNLIPVLLNAKPGLLSMLDLPIAPVLQNK